MTLDRQRTHALVQALLRARNMREGSGIFENAAQANISDDGSYRKPVFRGMGFTPAPQGTVTGNKAGSQPHRLIETPRPLPFRDQARGEFSDTAEARGIPPRGQLAFNDAPGTSSWPTNLKTTYGLPLAATVGMGLRQFYPSSCPSTDDELTFPPLINQDKAPLTEAEKDACHEQYDHDSEQCKNNYSYSREALKRCDDRAVTIRDLCLRGEKETLPWSDGDEDGIKLPKPPRGRKRK